MIRVADIFPAGWPDLFAPDARRVGLGLDLGTTTKAKSNPSALTITQQVGLTYFARLMLRWKTSDPAITEAILRHALAELGARGLRARKLCVDATSERFFAASLRRQLAGVVPVDLVIAAEKTAYLGEEMLYKAYLGNLLVNTLDDGYLALPPEEWVKRDFRQVTRDRGTFTAEVEEDGSHADAFGATSLSLHALAGRGGLLRADAAAVGGSARRAPGRKLHNPFARQFERCAVRTA